MKFYYIAMLILLQSNVELFCDYVRKIWQEVTDSSLSAAIIKKGSRIISPTIRILVVMLIADFQQYK
jgi:hypothetical protein